MKDLLIYKIPQMNAIQVQSDICYKSEKNKKLTFDICYPTDVNKSTKRPAVLLINGGVASSLKYSPKFREIFLSWGKLIASNGLIAINIIWRYKQPDDLISVITHVRKNATNLNIDEDRIATFSFSRGVELSYEKIIELNRYKSFIKCMVAYYGKLPLNLFQKDIKSLPPLLLAMAGNDRFFSKTCNDTFIENAYLKNTQVITLFHEAGEHAFDIRNDDEITKDIILKTIHFIKKHLISSI